MHAVHQRGSCSDVTAGYLPDVYLMISLQEEFWQCALPRNHHFLILFVLPNVQSLHPLFSSFCCTTFPSVLCLFQCRLWTHDAQFPSHLCCTELHCTDVTDVKVTQITSHDVTSSPEVDMLIFHGVTCGVTSSHDVTNSIKYFSQLPDLGGMDNLPPNFR